MEHHWENSYWVALFLCAVGAIYIYTYRQVHIPSAIAVDNKTDSTGACVPPYEYVYHAEPNTPNNWTRCMGSAFCVRHGPDYATNRYKASSSDSIYDVFAVSATNSKQKLPHIGRIAALPVDADALQLGAFGVPPYVILHVMVPRYVPSGMFGKKRKDGISSHLTVYGRLSESVRAMIREGRPSPAVSLLRKFVHPVEGARLRKERLKLIVGVVDMHEPGFDPITRAIIKAYNNKPFLSKTASTFYETDDYFEIDGTPRYTCLAE